MSSSTLWHEVFLKNGSKLAGNEVSKAGLLVPRKSLFFMIGSQRHKIAFVFHRELREPRLLGLLEEN